MEDGSRMALDFPEPFRRIESGLLLERRRLRHHDHILADSAPDPTTTVLGVRGPISSRASA